MKSLLPILIVVGVAPAATAQEVCSGSVLADLSLAVADEQGVKKIGLASAPDLFGRAECLCGNAETALDVHVTQGLPAGMQGQLEVWVGSSNCADYLSRIADGQTQCERVYAGNIAPLTAPQLGHDLLFPIDAAALVSPLRHDCNTPAADNSIFVFAFADASQPYASCTLPLTERLSGPAPAQELAVTTDGGDVKVAWAAPPVGAILPASFQLLCAHPDGTPARATSSVTPAYSTCLPGGRLFRRSVPSTALPDAMVLQTASTSPPGKGVIQTELPTPLTNLDPAFLCSAPIPVNAASFSARLEALDRSQPVEVAVLSIDSFGNATASPPVMIAAQSTALEPEPSGGCALAGEPQSSPLGLCVLVASMIAVAKRRRFHTYHISRRTPAPARARPAPTPQ
jgi:hypothetical protein